MMTNRYVIKESQGRVWLEELASTLIEMASDSDLTVCSNSSFKCFSVTRWCDLNVLPS